MFLLGLVVGVSAAAKLEEREGLCRNRRWGCQREDSREGYQTGSLSILTFTVQTSAKKSFLTL